MKKILVLATLVAASFLAACGGGGGEESTVATPVSVVAPPTITITTPPTKPAAVAFTNLADGPAPAVIYGEQDVVVGKFQRIHTVGCAEKELTFRNQDDSVNLRNILNKRHVHLVGKDGDVGDSVPYVVQVEEKEVKIMFTSNYWYAPAGSREKFQLVADISPVIQGPRVALALDIVDARPDSFCGEDPVTSGQMSSLTVFWQELPQLYSNLYRMQGASMIGSPLFVADPMIYCPAGTGCRMEGLRAAVIGGGELSINDGIDTFWSRSYGEGTEKSISMSFFVPANTFSGMRVMSVAEAYVLDTEVTKMTIDMGGRKVSPLFGYSEANCQTPFVRLMSEGEQRACFSFGGVKGG